MDELMQLLYNDITGRTMIKYYPQTEYEERRAEQDQIGRTLWEQLPPEQKELLEELQRAYDLTHLAELEAMFLASFDQLKSLAFSHFA